MSSSVLVTGGNGLIGNALKKILPDAIYITRKDGDFTDICQVKKIFKKVRPVTVFHLAAKVAGVKTNAEKNAEMLAVNVQINTNVLSMAREFGVQKLVTLLSTCAFRERPENPPSEKDVHVGMPYAGNLGYGSAKRLLDLQIGLLKQQYGCNFTSITPATVFGPFDNWDINDGHVMAALIHKCYLAKRNNEPFHIWGSGAAVRQFIFSYDVAHILFEVLKNYNDSETLIVSPMEGISIRELVEMITQVMDFKGPVIYDQTKPEGAAARLLNNAKFKTLFPNFKFTPLKDALQTTVQWFVENYSNARGIIA
ncbi:MAG: hypothetical protein A3I11_02080 [Elusimicrobia bacterium RIFCSPLOWO2_02_FULL_39_32]|nr:MAG: hypothetical protein A2034_04970 [Elusimicrobia bacterium GWA2_38_7]OGR78407.1 MAG: hypothetical protein A3B80_06965 [Elusimicrobia bacterium RIFCSPHIGHO2_02_FULL_39_36]OGR92166.1 MAG: hypothetical protein A3I11_02080 [Elusimicrobia bacterium RIFCSPLOWO2_02_FULL_39_32]OGR99966.1 MAG: hypothetical protein A3G85_03355 [Elusimicrobia bacterium RIFCSPLOWO2_12_FULL_39_28]